MRNFLPLFILLPLVGCIKSPTTATTVKGGAVNADAPYYWENPSFPKTMAISGQFSTDEITKIKAMGTAWKSGLSPSTNFFAYTEGASEKTTSLSNINQFNDGTLGIYKASSNWPYPDYPYALAVTQLFAIRYNRGASNEYVAIQEADIVMNYKNFRFDNVDPAVYDYDFQTVMLHEMGHFLGLSHKPTSFDRDDSVMYPSIYSSEEKRSPLPIDISDIASKYSISMLLGSSGSTASAMSGDESNYRPNPGEVGEKIKIIIELRAGGECVHTEDGVETQRHHIKLK